MRSVELSNVSTDRRSAQIAGEILQHDTGFSRFKKAAQRVQVGNRDSLFGKLRRHLPCAFARQLGKPGAQRLISGNQRTARPAAHAASDG